MAWEAEESLIDRRPGYITWMPSRVMESQNRLMQEMARAQDRYSQQAILGTFARSGDQPQNDTLTVDSIRAMARAMVPQDDRGFFSSYEPMWVGWDLATTNPRGTMAFRNQVARINEDPSYKALSETHRLVSADDTGRLFHVFIPTIEGKPYRAYVDVVNPTPHKDGSLSQHFIGVPPEMKTAREAVAWTYGLSADEYELELRT